MMKKIRFVIAAISLAFLLIIKQFYPFDKSEEPLVKAETMSLEEIEIVEVPFVSSLQEKITVVEAELQSGSNLNDLLINEGISRDEAASIVYEISPYVNLRSIPAGEVFELKFVNDVFSELKNVKTKNTIVQVVRDLKAENGFKAFETERELFTYTKRITGSIENSFYPDAIEAGMSANILEEFIELLAYDVDFQRDIQLDDTFMATYEALYDENGKEVGEGQLLCAQLITDGRDISFYHYIDTEGEDNYYDKNGVTIQKALLKTPINGAYVTSGFGMRVNPVTGFTRKHQGIDFGAAQGTPIYASGSGIIESAYYSPIYGNFIEIRHANGYKTLYAHMSAYKRGMRKGVRVNQHDVIGYVGNTGMSTGPHLHYEISFRGVKVNPSTVKSPPSRTLSGEELQLFENLKNSYIASFE